MIVRPAQHWFKMLFVWNGSVLQSIIPQLAVVGVFSVLAVATHGVIFGEKIPLSATTFTLFGFILAIFLVFRNNASFARFTEGRQLWGNAMVAARTITSQALSYLPLGAQERLADQLIAFTYALKHQLRGSDPSADLTRLLGVEQAQALQPACYKPVMILNQIRQQLAAASGSEFTRLMFDTQLNELEKCVGGCERILGTPIPFAYSVLLHRSVYGYCLLLPFGLVDSTEFLTPLMCLFISYTLIALEAIASEVGDPFGMAPNALPLDAIVRTTERSVLELCGRALPPDTAPASDWQLT